MSGTTRYYAVLDPDEPDTARNVFLVDDAQTPVAMVVFDHQQREWVQNTGLIDYIAGDRARDCAQIDIVQAQELLAAWHAQLPSDEEVRALAARG